MAFTHPQPPLLVLPPMLWMRMIINLRGPSQTIDTMATYMESVSYGHFMVSVTRLRKYDKPHSVAAAAMTYWATLPLKTVPATPLCIALWERDSVGLVCSPLPTPCQPHLLTQDIKGYIELYMALHWRCRLKLMPTRLQEGYAVGLVPLCAENIPFCVIEAKCLPQDCG